MICTHLIRMPFYFLIPFFISIHSFLASTGKNAFQKNVFAMSLAVSLVNSCKQVYCIQNKLGFEMRFSQFHIHNEVLVGISKKS